MPHYHKRLTAETRLKIVLKNLTTEEKNQLVDQGHCPHCYVRISDDARVNAAMSKINGGAGGIWHWEGCPAQDGEMVRGWNNQLIRYIRHRYLCTESQKQNDSS